MIADGASASAVTMCRERWIIEAFLSETLDANRIHPRLTAREFTAFPMALPCRADDGTWTAHVVGSNTIVSGATGKHLVRGTRRRQWEGLADARLQRAIIQQGRKPREARCGNSRNEFGSHVVMGRERLVGHRNSGDDDSSGPQ